MKAMILAAGEGRRMRPLTLDTPKPLLKAGGKALIEYHLENLAAAGFREIVINHAYLGEKIEQALGDGSRYGVEISYSRERQPLETAGGIIQALPLLGEEAFVIVNGDIWTDYPFDTLPALSGEEVLAHLVMVDNPPQHPEGDFAITAQGRLTAATASGAYTYSGIAVYHPGFFKGLGVGKRALSPLLRQAMHDSTVSGEYYKGLWFDIGTPQRLEELDRRLSQVLG